MTVQTASLAGLGFSAAVPAAWQLAFGIPLAFIALTAGFLEDRPTTTAALRATIHAVAAVGVRYTLGVLWGLQLMV